MNINNVTQNTFTIPPEVDDQLMISRVVLVPNDLNTFIVNVFISNNGEFLSISSFVFGKFSHTLNYPLSLGYLGLVTNIRSVIDNCTTISIYWDNPTLDDDRVSILYYNLSIYDDVNSQLIKTISVYDTSYQFEDKDLFIHRYTYVIVGVNELGEGISNNKTFSYQRGVMCISIKSLNMFYAFSSEVSSQHYICYVRAHFYFTVQYSSNVIVL